MAVVESSEVVASRKLVLCHCFKVSSVGGSQVGRSKKLLLSGVAKSGYTVYNI